MAHIHSEKKTVSLKNIFYEVVKSFILLNLNLVYPFLIFFKMENTNKHFSCITNMMTVLHEKYLFGYLYSQFN